LKLRRKNNKYFINAKMQGQKSGKYAKMQGQKLGKNAKKQGQKNV